MLLAILYQNEKIVAAAPACEQQPVGDQFWIDSLAVDTPTDWIVTPDNFEAHGYTTSYMAVTDNELCETLQRVGIDDSIDADALKAELENSRRPMYGTSRAA